jgi:hypothetical protein
MNEWLAESWPVVTLVFIAGTLAAGFVASRIWPARPYLAAVIAGLVFEADLLIIVQTGLSALAVAIAVTCTALLAVLGAFVGCRWQVRA